MKTYRIYQIWEMWGFVDVEAESLEEAEEKSLGYEVELPKEKSYIDDSIILDKEAEGYGEVVG